jgi:anti-sigma factor NepR-like protein
MQQAPPSFLQKIGQALRANFDAVALEPLPERWVDLIHHLNERERAGGEQRPHDKPRTSRNPRPH